MTHRWKRALALVSILLLAASACRTADDGGQAGDITDAGDIQTGAGVEGQTITIGELSPLTGPVEVIGKPLTLGHEVYWEYVNEELGGVGRDLDEADRFTVELITRDTQYVPDRHVEQFNAIRDEVLAIGQSLGTPTTRAILPQLQDDPILTGPATLSSAWLPEPYMFPAGAPYAIQFVNAAHHIVENEGTTPKAGIIYQNDDYGEEGLKGLRFASEQMDFEIVGEATYKVGDQDYTSQVRAMMDAGADHVFLTATPASAGGILGAAAQAGYSPRWIGQSPIWARALFSSEQLAPYMEANVWWVTDASCDWGSTDDGCDGMAQMVENLQTYAPEQQPDAYFQFGYTQALILHEVLEEAISRGDLTREGVIEAFHSLEGVEIGGLLNPVSYGPDCEDRVPATATNIMRVVPDAPLLVETVAEVDAPVVDEFPFCPDES